MEDKLEIFILERFKKFLLRDTETERQKDK